jgi:hypothetical protein
MRWKRIDVNRRVFSSFGIKYSSICDVEVSRKKKRKAFNS